MFYNHKAILNRELQRARTFQCWWNSQFIVGGTSSGRALHSTAPQHRGLTATTTTTTNSSVVVVVFVCGATTATASQFSLCAQFVKHEALGEYYLLFLFSLSRSVSCFTSLFVPRDHTWLSFRLWSCLCWEFKADPCLQLTVPRNRWENISNINISYDLMAVFCN